MMVIRGMARVTILGGTLEFTVDVALNALRGNVRAGQLESRQVVVKSGRFPGRGGVTRTAVRAIRASVRIFGLVAVNTI